MAPSFDKIDLKILKDLQEDGRITNVQLAENAGISAPPCLRRVRALEDANIIEGYHALLNPKILGFQVLIFAQVGLSSQSENDVRAFEEKAGKWPLVQECYLIAGEFDFLLKIITRDWDEYQEFHAQELTALPIVASVKSKLVIRTTKKQLGLPIELVTP